MFLLLGLIFGSAVFIANVIKKTVALDAPNDYKPQIPKKFGFVLSGFRNSSQSCDQSRADTLSITNTTSQMKASRKDFGKEFFKATSR